MTTQHEEAVRLAEKHGATAKRIFGNQQDLSMSAWQLATLVAEVRSESLATEPEIPADIKGRFQSELFWRGVYAMRDAIKAKYQAPSAQESSDAD